MPALLAGRRMRAPRSVLVLAAALAALSLLAVPPAVASTGGSGGSSGHLSQPQPPLPPVWVRENHAADVAIAHIGDPYRYGAAGPAAFDCSGLAMYSYDHSHLYLPRTAESQYQAVRHIEKSDLHRGDLVFFHTTSGYVYHVAIFLNWDLHHRAVIIHAPYPGTVVHRTTAWTTAWYAGTRRPPT